MGSFRSKRYPTPDKRGVHGDVCILLSGGIDSITLAYKAMNEDRLGAAIYIDYGHPATRMEQWLASKFISERQIAGHNFTIPMSWHPGIGLREPGSIGPMVIPGRNGLMLTLACQWAQNYTKLKEVWFGATLDDEKEYADCRMEFVHAINQMLAASELGITVKAPFHGMSKAEVVTLALELEVPLDLTWSCYTPVDLVNRPGGPPSAKPCGTCNACIQRAEAIKAART